MTSHLNVENTGYSDNNSDEEVGDDSTLQIVYDSTFSIVEEEKQESQPNVKPAGTSEYKTHATLSSVSSIKLLNETKDVELLVIEEPNSKTEEYEKKETIVLDIETLDKEKLYSILKATQCPLMPHRFSHSDKPKSAYWYADNFWVQNTKRPKECELIEYRTGNEVKNAEKYEVSKNKVEVIFAIDEYLKDLRINKSQEIYSKLYAARREVIDGIDDGDDSNDVYQILIPTIANRLAFVCVFLSVVLNGYFIMNNIVTVYLETVDYGSFFMYVMAFLTAVSELVLYGNVLFGYVFYSFAHLFIRIYKRNSTHFQEKAIALGLRNLSTLSILRYLPSVELVMNHVTGIHETVAKIWVEFFLLYKQCRNVCDIVFAIPVYFIEIIAPFLALFSILIKLIQLRSVTSKSIFLDWEFSDYLTFFAFLNQVAGLRVIRNIETTSIQHFVFSGSDAKLDRDELLLMNDWWDTTLLSSVSNIGLNWYDSMVFWYSLDPLRIQLLLKNHESGKDGTSLMQMIKENDDILDDYTQKVNQMLLS